MKLFPLSVHCWGGLGSQLFALNHAIDLHKKFPSRKIILKLHTSGATQRFSELGFINDLSFEIVQVDDFSLEDKVNPSLKLGFNFFQIKIKFMIKKFFVLVGVLSFANNDFEFVKLKPWVLSTRGHYMDRTITATFLEYILKNLNAPKNISEVQEFSLAIHYRMGDYLKLETKPVISPFKIVEVSNKVLGGIENFKVKVYSDSPIDARKALLGAGFALKFAVSSISTHQLMRECITADYFIGSNSKISLWIVNLRIISRKNNDSHLEGFDRYIFAPGKSCV